jgi:hypothetical protein
MARSSKPRHPYRPSVQLFELVLTQGGGAELIDESGEMWWVGNDDPEFTAEFSHFLMAADVADILDYLVEVGELNEAEADACLISEEFLEGAQRAGFVPS